MLKRTDNLVGESFPKSANKKLSLKVKYKKGKNQGKGEPGVVREGKANFASHENFHSDPHQPWYIRGQHFSFPQSQQPTQNEQSQSIGGFLPCSCSVSFLSC